MVVPPLAAAHLAAALPGRLAATAPRVVVVGDAVLDCWMAGPSNRLSREAPVPVVEIDRTRCAAGGAANTAVNLAALGAQVVLVAPIGDDADGATVRSLLADGGVDTGGLVVDPERHTASKRRILADDALVARYDSLPAGEIGAPVRAALAERLSDALAGGADAVVVCD